MFNRHFIRIILWLVTAWLSLGFGQQAHGQVTTTTPACWKKKDFKQTYNYGDLEEDQCDDINFGFAKAHASVAPHEANADGEAYDNCFGGGVGVIVQQVANKSEQWEYCGNLIGHLEGQIHMQGSGEANIQDAEAAAAALGYVSYNSNTSQGGYAALNNSGGATMAHKFLGLGLSIKGIGIEVPIIFGLGERVYPDVAHKTVLEYRCTNYWNYELNSEARIEVWANGNIVNAGICSAQLNLRTQGHVSLSELAPEECPGE